MGATRKEEPVTDSIDHAQKAIQLLGWIDTDEGRTQMAVDARSATITIAAAQVHATLALVEEQRASNDLTLRMVEANDSLLHQMRDVTEAARAGWEAHTRLIAAYEARDAT